MLRRNLNVNEADTMLVATLRWREEFKVEEAVKEEFPQEIFGNLGHVYGKDKEGRPVVYVSHLFISVYFLNVVSFDVGIICMAPIRIRRRYSETSSGSLGEPLGFLEDKLLHNISLGGGSLLWRRVCLTSTLKLLTKRYRFTVGVIRISYVNALTLRWNYLDYEGVSLTQRDANSKSAASEATSIFQNHYPEFLVSPVSLYFNRAFLSNLSFSRVNSLSTCPPSCRGFSGFSSPSYQQRLLRR
jgi:phosphatidylinositol transfer protein SFH5